jgi:hypothetical protein
LLDDITVVHVCRKVSLRLSIEISAAGADAGAAIALNAAAGRDRIKCLRFNASTAFNDTAARFN